MWNTKRGIEKLLGIIILLLLPFLIIPAAIFGGETDKKFKEESKAQPDFVLTIKDNLISLDAKDASLKEIVEEIGHRMKIEVITKIPEQTKVTMKFDKLPLEAAIERLREYADIAYIKDSKKEKGKVTKILVFPKKEGEELSKPPFKEEGEKLAKPESGVEKEDTQIGPEDEEAIEEEGSSRPEPFKFEFDPSEFEEE